MSGDALAPGLAEAGRPHADAAASKIDDTMKQCILTLYRSAVDLGAEWQPTVERNERPALVIWGTNDPYCSDDPYAQRLADRTHSEVRLVEGGHWAMFERPAETARILEEFWSEAR
jgi:pimeloyl-ACP methyl ester carboxylesterase